MRIDAYVHNAAAEHDVQSQLAGTGHDCRIIGAGIEPNLAGRFLCHLFQDLESNLRRQIQAYAIEAVYGHVEN